MWNAISKPIASRTATALCAVTAMLAACGGGSEVLLIPLFEFGFSGTTTGPTQMQLFLGPDQPTASTGTFTFANMNVGATQFQYAGTWNGCNFSISTNQAVTAPGAASYAGHFTGNDTIVMTPTSGNNLPTLTLQRQGVGTRQTGC